MLYPNRGNLAIVPKLYLNAYWPYDSVVWVDKAGNRFIERSPIKELIRANRGEI